MASQLGRIEHDRKRGMVRWYLVFPGFPRIYSFPLPTHDRRQQFKPEPAENVPPAPPRVKGKPSPPRMFPQCPGWVMAKEHLDSIRADVRRGDPLEVALAPYMASVSARHAVSARWREFVEARTAERLERPITDHRLRELARMPERGYLAYFEEQGISVLSLTTASLKKWVTWMFNRWPSPPAAHERSTPRSRVNRHRNWRTRAAELQAAAEAGTPLERPKPAPSSSGYHTITTRRHIVNDFMQFCAWLKSEQIIREVPDKPALPEQSARRVAIPTEEELDAYLAAIPEPVRGLWLARGRCGLRPKEARSLQLRHYRPPVRDARGEIVEPGWFHLEITKTEKGKRPVPIDYKLQDWLDAHVPLGAQQFTPDALVFQNPHAYTPERAWTEDAERQVHLVAIEQSGIPYYRPNHMGRHATATHLASRGVDVRTLGDLLGHADQRTTERHYIHVREEQRKDALARTLRPRPAAPRTAKRRTDEQ